MDSKTYARFHNISRSKVISHEEILAAEKADENLHRECILKAHAYYPPEPLNFNIEAPKRFHVGYFPCALECFFAWPEGDDEKFLDMLAIYLFRRMQITGEGSTDKAYDMSVCRRQAGEIFRGCGGCCIRTLDLLQIPFRNGEVPQRLIETLHPNPAYVQFHPYTDHTLMEEDLSLIVDVMTRLDFQPTMANYVVKARLEMEYRYANEVTADGIGDLIPRELFHFAGQKYDKSKQVVCLYLLGHGVNQATAAEILAKEKMDHAFYSAFHSDLFEEFQKLGDASSVGRIIAGSLLFTIEKVIIAFWERTSTFGNKNKHLIIIADFCFSGGMLQFSAHAKKVIDWLKERSCFVYIQTSSSSTQSSQGYFYTPLFYQLQRLSIEKYKELRKQFATTDPNVLSSLLEGCHQVPYFYTSNDAVSSAKSEIAIHGVRMFRDPKFFAFMAEVWQKEAHSLVPFHIATGVSAPSRAGEVSMHRFMFNYSGGKKDFDNLLKDFSADPGTTYKIGIMGVKLFFDAEFNKPEAICGFRCPRWKNSYGKEYYLLHIHFSDGDPFPGVPTYWKVINGVWDKPRDTHGAGGILSDQKTDKDETTRTANSGDFTLSKELIDTIARYVDHYKGECAWSNRVNWGSQKITFGANALRDRNIALINLSSPSVPL